MKNRKYTSMQRVYICCLPGCVFSKITSALSLPNKLTNVYWTYTMMCQVPRIQTKKVCSSPFKKPSFGYNMLCVKNEMCKIYCGDTNRVSNRFRSDYISSGLRYFVGKNIETRCQANWSWRMSGKDKPDKMERKLDLGILKPVPIHLFPLIILTLLSQKVFLVYSKIKKKKLSRYRI